MSTKTIRRFAALTAVAAATLAVPLAEPASAHSISVTTGAATINVIGPTPDAAAEVTCSGGNLALQPGNIRPVPNVPCSAVTSVTVEADGSDQEIRVTGLDAASFSSLTAITVSGGGGSDTVHLGARGGTVHGGPGNDNVFLQAQGGSSNIYFGAGQDSLIVTAGQTGRVTAATSGTTLTLTHQQAGRTHTITSPEQLAIYGTSGNDILDAANIQAPSGISNLYLNGAEGDDEVIGGSVPHDIYGGGGSNRLQAGPHTAMVVSESHTDTIVGNAAGGGSIWDATGLRSGGRTYEGNFAGYELNTLVSNGDVVARFRPDGGGAYTLTTSLNRTGTQRVPASMMGTRFAVNSFVLPLHRSLNDLVAMTDPFRVDGHDGTDLLDITVPVGTWTIGGTAAAPQVTFSNGYGTITGSKIDSISVHGPWTNKNQGFAHRVHRDLLFRFPTDAWRDTTRDQLTAGSRTRTGIVSTIMNTEEYRGLDVDRIFVNFLRRKSDPSGRAFWIANTGEGKRTLRTFRAQLFGSPEYFQLAGATNASWVDRAYRDVIGRLPEASGRAYWIDRLNNGADRGVIARTFLATPEAREFLVRDQYLRFLNRPADPGAISTWVARLNDNTVDHERNLIATLAASAEYHNAT